MNWYYIDGPLRVGPLNEREWEELLRTGKITPETLVWHEGMEKWTPYRQVAHEAEPPELDEEPEAEEPLPDDPMAYAARVADLDYTLDIRACVSRAWAVFKRYFWMTVGSTLLIMALIFTGTILPYVGFLMTMLFRGVLMGGLNLVFLRLMRNEPVEVPDLFAGFGSEYFKPLAFQTLVVHIVAQLCMIPFAIAMATKGAALATAGSYAEVQAFVDANPETAMVLLLVMLAGMIPAVYFSFCWMFAVPLIVDKKMPFWPAMQLSRAKVLQHPWRVSLVAVLAGVFGMIGFFGFGIGIIFTLPLGPLIILALYEEIFVKPDRKSPEPGAQTE